MGRLSSIVRVASKCHHKCLYKRGTEGGYMHRRGEGNVTTETEIQVMWPQDKERYQPPEAKEARNRFFPKALGEAQDCQYLGFIPVKLISEFWFSRSVRQLTSLFRSHPIYGNLL